MHLLVNLLVCSFGSTKVDQRSLKACFDLAFATLIAFGFSLCTSSLAMCQGTKLDRLTCLSYFLSLIIINIYYRTNKNASTEFIPEPPVEIEDPAAQPHSACQILQR